MKKGERFRIAVETGVVVLLAVGVFRFYQVKQQQKTRDKETPSLSDDRGLGKLIKMRADGKEEPARTKTSPKPEKKIRRSETGTPVNLPEHALLVIQIVDRNGAAFLEPFTVYSRQGQFTNRVASGRLALSLSAMELKIAGRWDEVRVPSEKELSITLVIGIKIEEASVKIRAGKPVDDDEDYSLPIWSGELPLVHKYTTPITDESGVENLEVPPSVKNLLNLE